MNRAQRRAQVKELQRGGMKRQQAKTLVENYFALELKEGDRVMINYELCIRHPEWKTQKDEFKEFVEKNKHEIFTVEYDTEGRVSQAERKLVVCFKEDTSEPKWLFNALTLTPIPTCKVDLEDGDSFTVDLPGVTSTTDPKAQEIIDKAIEEHKNAKEQSKEAE